MGVVDVVGAALEGVGVLVLVAEIVRWARRTRAYRSRPQVVEVGTIEATPTLFSPSIVTEPPPAVEERVDRLEEGLARLRNDLEERIGDLRAEARDVADEAAGRATRHGERRFDALERLVIGETRVDLWLRVGSIVAVVLGIILATIGSVAG